MFTRGYVNFVRPKIEKFGSNFGDFLNPKIRWNPPLNGILTHCNEDANMMRMNRNGHISRKILK
jgi:hypothetical protein